MKSLTARLVLQVLLVHAVVLPLLFFGVLTIVERAQKDIFIDHVRNHARLLSDMFELPEALDSDSATVDLLDSVLLSGYGNYAELQTVDQRISSSLSNNRAQDAFDEDFAFGQHDDRTYYLSVPVVLRGRQAILRLGFDEQPTIERIERVRKWALVVLIVYLLVTVALMGFLSIYVTRPLRVLGKSSREITSGRHTQQLIVDSGLVEIDELAQDLEHMRSSLVGTNTRLEKEVKDRTAAERDRNLMQARLRQAQRVETIGTLAGGIAHEFNNVLLPIVLYTELAIGDLPKDSPVLANLTRSLKSATRAKEIVEQILTFSREVGELRREPVDMCLIVEEAMGLLRALVPATIHLHSDLQPDGVFVLGDVNQLHQVVMNLCSNAYQSMAKSGGRLEVAVDASKNDSRLLKDHPHARDQEYLRLRVSDVGDGMDSATIDRVFDPFFTTRAVGEGTGLGLSVVDGIVASHGGAVATESEIDKGSSFFIYLPRVESPVAESESVTDSVEV